MDNKGHPFNRRNDERESCGSKTFWTWHTIAIIAVSVIITGLFSFYLFKTFAG
jgi:hypothetical protein